KFKKRREVFGVPLHIIIGLNGTQWRRNHFPAGIRTAQPRTFLVTPRSFSKDVTLCMHLSSLRDKAVSAAESSAPPTAVAARVYGASLDFGGGEGGLGESREGSWKGVGSLTGLGVGSLTGVACATVEGPGIKEEECVGGTIGGGRGGGTSCAAAAPAATASTPSPPVGTTNMGAKRGICEEAASTEQDIDLDALHKLASTSLGGDSTIKAAYTIYKASQDVYASSDAGHAAAEVPDDTTMPFRHTLPAVEGIPAGSITIPAGSSIDPTVQAAAAAPSSTIPAADKGKAPMLGEELAKKLHAEQEEEFARRQQELAQKAQAKSVVSPTKQGTGLSDQHRRELDLLGDDVNVENMNERLGMLFMRKKRELAEQSQVKRINKTQQRDYMRNFVKNQSAFVYNQGWTIKQVPASVPTVPSVAAAVLVPAAPSVATDVSVPAVPPDPAVDYAHIDTEVHADESNPDDTTTASEQVSVEHTVSASTS
nr:hypothetical protein [Tanacetum cinerariifolium]